jgi:hypothetical protein
MIKIGAHTFDWSPSLNDDEATAIYARRERSKATSGLLPH